MARHIVWERQRDNMNKIIVPARIDLLPSVLEFIEGGMAEAGVSGRDQNSVAVAAEEIFVNITNYAYPSGEGDVTVQMDAKRNKIILEFIDSGIPFDPLHNVDPDTSLQAGDREIGGLGIYMVKKMMDEVEYRYVEGHNVLALRKNF